MRILYVIDSLGRGGTERSLAELLPLLRDAGHLPSVACLDRREGIEDEVVADGFEVYHLPRPLPARLFALRRRICRLAPAVVHTSLTRSNIAGRLAAAGTGVHVVSSLVNVTYGEARRRDPRVHRGKLEVIRRLDSWTARRLTDRLHAVSETVKAEAVAALGVPPERITVIPRGRSAERLGAPSPERRGAARRRLGLRDDAPVLVNVGRQEFQKGQRTLLAALASLAPRHPALQLLVAGREGAVTGELLEQSRSLGTAERVRWLGFRSDLPEVLAAADLFVFPSLYEGLPGALIEAMALGLPIVASDIAPVREVVEERKNALLVPVGDAEGLARAIDELLRDTARANAYGRRSRSLFEERFTLEPTARAMSALYETLCPS